MLCRPLCGIFFYKWKKFKRDPLRWKSRSPKFKIWTFWDEGGGARIFRFFQNLNVDFRCCSWTKISKFYSNFLGNLKCFKLIFLSLLVFISLIVKLDIVLIKTVNKVKWVEKLIMTYGATQCGVVRSSWLLILKHCGDESSPMTQSVLITLVGLYCLAPIPDLCKGLTSCYLWGLEPLETEENSGMAETDTQHSYYWNNIHFVEVMTLITKFYKLWPQLQNSWVYFKLVLPHLAPSRILAKPKIWQLPAFKMVLSLQN